MVEKAKKQKWRRLNGVVPGALRLNYSDRMKYKHTRVLPSSTDRNGTKRNRQLPIVADSIRDYV